MGCPSIPSGILDAGWAYFERGPLTFLRFSFFELGGGGVCMNARTASSNLTPQSESRFDFRAL
jgi:hypothetical protein